MRLLEKALADIKSVDADITEEARVRVDSLIKPQGSLGDLEEIYVQLAGITGELHPDVSDKAIIVMAGDHRVIEEGVATSGHDITKIQAVNMTRGVTAVCALAKQSRADVVVVDVGIIEDVDNDKLIHRKVKYGADNFTKGPAMTYEEAIQAIEVGIEIAHKEIDNGKRLLGTGEMGIGNTTPSAAIVSVITGCSPEEATGVGANLPMERLKNKINVIANGIELNKPDASDGVDVLAKVGGLEIGGMAGVMIGGASKGVPVVVDGFISMAAALIACTIEPKVKHYIIASHFSMEKGAKIASDYLSLKTPLNLGMRLGEGTGAAIMFNVIEASCYMNDHMLTFSEAGFIVD